MIDVLQENAHGVAYRSWLRERGLPPSAVRSAGAVHAAPTLAPQLSSITYGPIAVVVDQPDHFTEVEASLLAKILHALGQEIRTTLIVGSSSEQTWKSLNVVKGPKCAVFFGSAVAARHLAGSCAQDLSRGEIFINQLQSPLPLMVTLSLQGLAENPESKRIVWGDLKLAMEEVKVQR